jgi:hypothetical protein
VLALLAVAVSARAGLDGGHAGARGTDPGFDVSGSHPLPNGGTRRSASAGGCGCRVGSPSLQPANGFTTSTDP